MNRLRVLLVCGSGASSGFMAANMRKAAKEMNQDNEIKARSESEIESYIDDIDALMVGPHLAYVLDDIDEYTDGRDIPVVLMKAEYYSSLDGKKAIEHLYEAMNQKK